MWLCMVVWCTKNLHLDGISFMWHQPCQRCKYTTLVDIQKHAIKSYSCRITRERSESAGEQGILLNRHHHIFLVYSVTHTDEQPVWLVVIYFNCQHPVWGCVVHVFFCFGFGVCVCVCFRFTLSYTGEQSQWLFMITLVNSHSGCLWLHWWTVTVVVYDYCQHPVCVCVWGGGYSVSCLTLVNTVCVFLVYSCTG